MNNLKGLYLDILKLNMIPQIVEYSPFVEKKVVILTIPQKNKFPLSSKYTLWVNAMHECGHNIPWTNVNTMD